MIQRLIVLLLLMTPAYTAVAQEPTGVLTGMVRDKNTQEPLIGIGVGLEGTSMGTVIYKTL